MHIQSLISPARSISSVFFLKKFLMATVGEAMGAKRSDGEEFRMGTPAQHEGKVLPSELWIHQHQPTTPPCWEQVLRAVSSPTVRLGRL